MDENNVTEKLIEVLQEIQSNSGYDSEGIAPETCPLVDLEGFDSQLWPVAISMLAKTLGVKIPNNKNIYVSDDGTQRLTIKESAAVVCKVANEQ
ncbi:MAG: hypothetical protein QOG23_1940 [Blastocatellia bacterium]|jgi:hypothetical protein|nr:hypothetical protein [Blastocatellia bacterium]